MARRATRSISKSIHARTQRGPAASRSCLIRVASSRDSTSVSRAWASKSSPRPLDGPTFRSHLSIRPEPARVRNLSARPFRRARKTHFAQWRLWIMDGFDFAPLFRSTIGFDRLLRLADAATRFDGSGYPPYNIESTGENAYRLTVAVAGFSHTDISIEAKENTLTIKGETQAKAEEKKGEVLYQGIAARAFERVFQLAEHVEVRGASLENGLLHVDLVREVPEAMKPRRITIGNGKTKVIDAKAA